MLQKVYNTPEEFQAEIKAMALNIEEVCEYTLLAPVEASYELSDGLLEIAKELPGEPAAGYVLFKILAAGFKSYAESAEDTQELFRQAKILQEAE